MASSSRAAPASASLSMEERMPAGRPCNRCLTPAGSTCTLWTAAAAAVSLTSASSRSGRASRAGPSAALVALPAPRRPGQHIECRRWVNPETPKARAAGLSRHLQSMTIAADEDPNTPFTQHRVACPARALVCACYGQVQELSGLWGVGPAAAFRRPHYGKCRGILRPEAGALLAAGPTPRAATQLAHADLQELLAEARRRRGVQARPRPSG
jgi:hypothetical protein